LTKSQGHSQICDVLTFTDETQVNLLRDELLIDMAGVDTVGRNNITFAMC